MKIIELNSENFDYYLSIINFSNVFDKIGDIEFLKEAILSDDVIVVCAVNGDLEGKRVYNSGFSSAVYNERGQKMFEYDLKAKSFRVTDEYLQILKRDNVLFKKARLNLLKLNTFDYIRGLFSRKHDGINDVVSYSSDDENSPLELISMAVISKNKTMFSDNDVTKYFKYDEDYLEYIKRTKFDNDSTYFELAKISSYTLKLNAFEFAKNKLNEEYDFDNFMTLLGDEASQSKIINKINEYMVRYMESFNASYINWFEYFYRVSVSELPFLNFDSHLVFEYEEFLKCSSYSVSKNNKKYYDADFNNTIVIDSYMDLEDQNYSNVCIYEGIKKRILDYFKNSDNKQVYLAIESNDNLDTISFFEFNDSLKVDDMRKIHMIRLNRSNYRNYLDRLDEKISNLYGCNFESKVNNRSVFKRKGKTLIKK